jgi:hypothetical protein
MIWASIRGAVTSSTGSPGKKISPSAMAMTSPVNLSVASCARKPRRNTAGLRQPVNLLVAELKTDQGIHHRLQPRSHEISPLGVGPHKQGEGGRVIQRRSKVSGRHGQFIKIGEQGPGEWGRRSLDGRSVQPFHALEGMLVGLVVKISHTGAGHPYPIVPVGQPPDGVHDTNRGAHTHHLHVIGTNRRPGFFPGRCRKIRCIGFWAAPAHRSGAPSRR